MAKQGKNGITWTDETWNPIIGCSRVSEGCRHCYAETQAARIVSMDRAAGRDSAYELLVRMDDDGNPRPLWTGKVELMEDRLEQPLRWKRSRRIFVNSMSDLFHPEVPGIWIDSIFTVMALSYVTMDEPHIFQVLTKRPERMQEYLCDPTVASRIARIMKEVRPDLPGENTAPTWPLPNVWLGFSAEDQVTFDERWEPMQHVAEMGWLVWCSAEPLLGEIELPDSALCECLDCDALIWEHRYEKGPFYHNEPLLSWVVVGGESGKNARPMHPDWARSLRDQCVEAGVPFLFKQWGEWAPNCLCETQKPHPETPRPEPGFPGVMFRCGKKSAGRLLDDREWNEYPEVEG